MRPISVSEAKALGKRIGDGELDDNPELKQRGLQAIQQAVSRQNVKIIDTAQPDTGSQKVLESVADVGDAVGGLGEAALTVGTSAVSELGSGIAGLSFLGLDFFTGRDIDPDKAAEVAKDVQEAFTFTPKTSGGKRLLNTVAAPLQKLDEVAKDVSAFVGAGNPYAQTAVYTIITGGSELAGLKGAGRLKVGGSLKKAEDAAKKLGLEPTNQGLQASVVEAARDMTPANRGDNAPLLREALNEAKGRSSERVKILDQQSKDARLFVDVQETRAFSTTAAKSLLEEGFELDKMPNVQNRLNEIIDLDNKAPLAANRRSTPVLASRIQDVQTIRNRVAQGAGGNGAESRALTQLGNKMDEFLDNQFNADMIQGNPEAIARWKEANIASTAHTQRFSGDKALKQLMDMQATPEQLSAWLLGANSAGLKQSGAVIRKLEGILGPDHPAMIGVRQDFLYNIAEPLFRETPNLRGFIDNYDKILRNNKSITDALGIKQTDLAPLRAFAVASLKNPPNSFLRLFNNKIPRAMAVWIGGNPLAKNALKIGVTSNIIKLLSGHDRLAKRAIMADAMGAMTGQPVIPKGSVNMGRIIQASFLADIAGTQNEIDRKNKQR